MKNRDVQKSNNEQSTRSEPTASIAALSLQKTLKKISLQGSVCEKFVNVQVCVPCSKKTKFWSFFRCSSTKLHCRGSSQPWPFNAAGILSLQKVRPVGRNIWIWKFKHFAINSKQPAIVCITSNRPYSHSASHDACYVNYFCVLLKNFLSFFPLLRNYLKFRATKYHFHLNGI